MSGWTAWKTEKQNWIKIVNIMMVFNLCVQNQWAPISAIRAMVMAKENDKYSTELQWENGKEHILSANQGLFHRVEQKGDEFYLLLLSLQPTTLPTAFLWGARNDMRLNELKARGKNCTRFPKLWLCQFSGALFLLERVHFSWITKHIMSIHRSSTMLLLQNRAFSKYKQCSDSLCALAGRLCLLQIG